MKLKKLEEFCRERGYSVKIKRISRTIKMYEWYKNSDHSIGGISNTVIETYKEINCTLKGKKEGKDGKQLLRVK